VAMGRIYSETERGEMDAKDNILEIERNQKMYEKTAKEMDQ